MTPPIETFPPGNSCGKSEDEEDCVSPVQTRMHGSSTSTIIATHMDHGHAYGCINTAYVAQNH